MLEPGMTRTILVVYGHRCQYCGRKATDADHIIPMKLGGSDEPNNLTASCRNCNASKGARRLSDEVEKRVKLKAFIKADFVREIHQSYTSSVRASRELLSNTLKG